MTAATPSTPIPTPNTLFVRNGKSTVFRPLSEFATRLWLTSTTLLFVELMLIRWVPAEIRYIGFFSNFLLMASFLGIGLGILLGRRGARWSLVAFPLLLMVVVVIITVNQLNIEVQGGTGEIWFGLTDAAKNAADTNYTVLILAVVMVTAVMAALAMPLGPLLKSMPPLKAYAIDIIGSMTGIALFGVMSLLGTSPTIWFGVVAVLVILLVLGTRIDAWALLTVVVVLAIILPVARSNPNDIWSPYYRITQFTDGGGQININVNGIPHQGLHCVTCAKEPFYEQIYKWFPDKQYKDVLIVGAGSGSDVALALARNNPTIESIDAVEIDPDIQQIGVDEHPNQPYQDPRVHRYINDGRAFLRSTDKQYDLIVFALPDSLTLVSQAANVRLESFLFTEEAFKSVADHLNPDDGIFVLYNYYRDPWLVAKLDGMLKDAFGGTQPLLRTYSSVMAAIADGPLVAKLNGAPPPGDAVDPVPVVGDPVPRPATDDWPFLYLRTGFVADYYIVALAIILLGALIAVGLAARVTGHQLPAVQPPLLRPGHRIPAAGDPQPGQLQPAVRDHLAGQRIRLLRRARQRAHRHLHQLEVPDTTPQPAVRDAVHRGGHRVSRATREPAHQPARAALRARGRARLRTRVLRQPRVQPLVPGHPDRGHGVRQQPAGCHGWWRARVPRADHRLPGAAAAGGRVVRPGLAVRHALPAHGGPRPGAGRGAGLRVDRSRGGGTSPGGLMAPVYP